MNDFKFVKVKFIRTEAMACVGVDKKTCTLTIKFIYKAWLSSQMRGYNLLSDSTEWAFLFHSLLLPRINDIFILHVHSSNIYQLAHVSQNPSDLKEIHVYVDDRYLHLHVNGSGEE